MQHLLSHMFLSFMVRTSPLTYNLPCCCHVIGCYAKGGGQTVNRITRNTEKLAWPKKQTILINDDNYFGLFELKLDSRLTWLAL